VPIARVQFRNESFTLTNFIPPMLSVPITSGLGHQATQLAKRVREKAVFLSEKVRAQNAAVRESRVLDLQQAVVHLSAGLPHVEAVLASGTAHPFALYLSLCTLAGNLAGVSSGTVPPAFRRYEHNDLRATFDPVLEFCERMLERVHESYSVLTFHFEEDAFKLGLQPAWASGNSLVVGAVARRGMSEADVATWFEAARIGSESVMPSIRERRIRGAQRTRIDAADELGLVPSAGVLLFRVQADPDLIQPGGTLVIAHPAEHTGVARPAELILYAGTGA
jgi:type VI secretion system protein ImpJ